MEFESFGKIPRLRRGILITEKIDGTNAQVMVDEDGTVTAGSRNRIITPQEDNYGFAGWVQQNHDFLRDTLNVGRHFGEWWGVGINRGYGQSRRWFSLFNTKRWQPAKRKDELTACAWERVGLSVVPILGSGPFDSQTIDWAVNKLVTEGSVAAPGFMDPEGIVVYHTQSNMLFKQTIKNDEEPKSKVKAA